MSMDPILTALTLIRVSQPIPEDMEEETSSPEPPPIPEDMEEETSSPEPPPIPSLIMSPVPPPIQEEKVDKRSDAEKRSDALTDLIDAYNHLEQVYKGTRDTHDDKRLVIFDDVKRTSNRGQSAHTYTFTIMRREDKEDYDSRGCCDADHHYNCGCDDRDYPCYVNHCDFCGDNREEPLSQQITDMRHYVSPNEDSDEDYSQYF